MAVTGLPDAQPDHAERIVRFAQECQLAFSRLTRELEKELGPATGGLQMRMGIASGPVTAGVLFGAASRFHLFGKRKISLQIWLELSTDYFSLCGYDEGLTVKRATELQETCSPNRIQFSQKTADLLVAAGRKKWIEPRRDAVSGARMQAYYLTRRKTESKDNQQAAIDSSFCSNLSVGSDIGLWDDDDEEELVVVMLKEATKRIA